MVPLRSVLPHCVSYWAIRTRSFYSLFARLSKVNRFKKNIISGLAKIVNLPQDDIERMLEIPAESNRGDFAFPCFQLSKIRHQPPPEIAMTIATELGRIEGISSVENIGPYVNFRVDNTILAKEILSEIYQEKEKFGQTDTGKNRTVVIDYSSPNIAKPFHVGHLRSTIIGNCLKNVYQALGYRVISINYLGDWGKQFGLLVLAFQKWGDKEELKEDPLKYLYKLYVKINRAAEEDPCLDSKARLIFKQMEKGDERILEYWQKFRTLSIKKYEEIYNRLGISFDVYSGESQYNEYMKKIIREIKDKKLWQSSQGAKIIDLQEYNLNIALLKKEDGSTLYLTRDIAAADERCQKYHFDKMLYVVGTDQKLHFGQLFKILELLERKWASSCVHVDFGRVQGMSTRKGKTIFLEDLLDEGQKRGLEKMKTNLEKFSQLKNAKLTADICGLSAIIFADLSSKRIKNYQFDWNQVLNFEGDTGLYLQNAHARIAGIMRKSGVELTDKIDYSALKEKEAVSLIRWLTRYPEILKLAGDKYEPSFLCTYLLELARYFHKAYHLMRVKGEA
ncbi:MAG: arginine--tRNA ligase, partial [Clostridia bacterium]|nr:arginine--tRNA ligase [Clostridia bacterium]